MLPALPIRRACTASFLRHNVEGAVSPAIDPFFFFYQFFGLEFFQRPLRSMKQQSTLRQLNKLRCRSNLTLLNDLQRRIAAFTHPILSTKSVMHIRNSHLATYFTVQGGGQNVMWRFGYFFCHTVGI